MIKEIKAKQLLITTKHPSGWFGVKYNMNIYRGCEHQCIYCDSRSECYQIEDFNDIVVKINAIELLRKELSRKRKKATVGTGSMSDPYTMIEKEYQLTRKALQVIDEFRYPVHITTKSNLVLRDIEILENINRIYANIAFTITTTDDNLSKKIEPNCPLPSERLKAMGILSTIGICVGITMMPILPYINDNRQNIKDIVKKASQYGAKYIYPAFGVTLRDRQRNYYYDKLDKYFPGLKEKYEKKFGTWYSCSANNSKKLKEVFYEACYKYGVSTNIPTYENKITSVQMGLFDQ